MNLPHAYDTFNYVISRGVDIPNDEGLLFPYCEDLVKDDHQTIPEMLSRQLFRLLAEDETNAHATLQALVAGWDMLKITSWGKELSHMFTGLRLAFETGAAYRATVSSEGYYSGFILSGGYFSVSRGGTVFSAQAFASLQTAWDAASPHASSLVAIYDDITFPDDMARNSARVDATCMYDVGLALRTHGYNSVNLVRIKSHLSNLAFARDRYLQLNAGNLTTVLNCISSGKGEEDVPLHHVAVFSTNRTHRLLSAFGPVAPSFRVEGGRLMPLTGDFTISQKTKQGQVKKAQVVSMFTVLKGWEKACEDFDLVVSSKDILSPAGTTLAGRASSRSLIRSFDGDQGKAVLASLRKVCGVMMTEGSGSLKRKAEDDGRGEAQKKARSTLYDFM
jgi:hypothetical protein